MSSKKPISLDCMLLETNSRAALSRGFDKRRLRRLSCTDSHQINSFSHAMSDVIDLSAAILQQLQSLARSGVRDLPTPRPQTEKATARGSVAPTELTLPRDNRRIALQVVRDEVSQCTRCNDLVCSRTQTVFGVGNIQPRLCFFGEAPGADEDAQGEPFVGRAGQLLNKIIAACKLTRDEVYILNAIKCRPENNRTPTDAEIDNCWEYARRQLEILQPEFICCLGAVAARALLKRKDSIGRMRQKFFDYEQSRVIVTYHPAYLLREPSAKKDVWDDMQMLMKAMGVSV